MNKEDRISKEKYLYDIYLVTTIIAGLLFLSLGLLKLSFVPKNKCTLKYSTLKISYVKKFVLDNI